MGERSPRGARRDQKGAEHRHGLATLEPAKIQVGEAIHPFIDQEAEGIETAEAARQADGTGKAGTAGDAEAERET